MGRKPPPIPPLPAAIPYLRKMRVTRRHSGNSSGGAYCEENHSQSSLYHLCFVHRMQFPVFGRYGGCAVEAGRVLSFICVRI